MATSEWIQFFRDAGIPPGPAVSYAVTFVDNRIHKHMLLDLTKELMHDLGITLVGDVIAILKHAKVAYKQEMCRAATEALTPPRAPPEPQRRCANSAAGRMIANSLSRDPPSISITVPNHSTVYPPPPQPEVAEAYTSGCHSPPLTYPPEVSEAYTSGSHSPLLPYTPEVIEAYTSGCHSPSMTYLPEVSEAYTSGGNSFGRALPVFTHHA
ncbi:uncharacterized protein C19orf47 homolog [Coturnix japonica]|uniref:uncharacterized protein C19orf47 homolog n=1 Tax=Coturnix japonica TaxID=93934 RepID=UPI0013A5E5B1|nr:uncharacterized protein C19orf47 homolog [Coturnix japonica]